MLLLRDGMYMLVMCADVRTSGNTCQRTEGRDPVSELTTLQLFRKTAGTAGDIVSVHARVH